MNQTKVKKALRYLNKVKHGQGKVRCPANPRNQVVEGDCTCGFEEALEIIKSLENPQGCTCQDHLHQPSKGGCSFGGSLIPACSCTWRD